MFDIQKCATIKEEGIIMQRYLPSKFFIAVAASTLFIISGGYFVFFYESRSTNQESRGERARPLAAQKGEASLFADKDADNDGLKDWEEVLWHTDPQKADTDGDGTNDNDEVLAKRDPTKAGPNDHIDQPPLTKGGIGEVNNSTESEPDTLTEQLARDFGEAYMRQKFGKGEVDGEYLSKILFSDITKKLTEKNEENKEVPDIFFKTSDFSVSADSSRSAFRRYFNALGDVFSKPRNTPNQNELEFFSDAIAGKDEKRFEELLAYRDSYRMLVEGMKTIIVPEVMMPSHVHMANSFWRLSMIVERMSEFEKDPIEGIAASNAYLIEARRSLLPLKLMLEQIKASNLTFEKEEAGSLFTSYLSKL